jgi:4-hydroxybenzoyl-CoA thioesterase
MADENNTRRTFQMAHRIRFSECDPAGIVFYPQYFVLFNDLLEAWVDDILQMGFTGYILDQRWGLPTVHLEADFKAVSRMGDDVMLNLQVEHVGNRSLILGLNCTGVKGDLRMRVKQTMVSTDLHTHRSIPIPAPLRAALGDDPAGKPRP